MAIPLEQIVAHVAGAVSAQTRREEIVANLSDAGMAQEDASQVVGEMVGMRNDLRRADPDRPVNCDALLARWYELRGETTPEVIASWRDRGRIAAEARRKELAVERAISTSKPDTGKHGPETGAARSHDSLDAVGAIPNGPKGGRSGPGLVLGAYLGGVFVHPPLFLLVFAVGVLNGVDNVALNRRVYGVEGGFDAIFELVRFYIAFGGLLLVSLVGAAFGILIRLLYGRRAVTTPKPVTETQSCGVDMAGWGGRLMLGLLMSLSMVIVLVVGGIMVFFCILVVGMGKGK